jgi:probable F420-dependent oxidoreductase
VNPRYSDTTSGQRGPVVQIDGMDLGQFGVWTFDFEDQPAAQMGESIQELEQLGFKAFWIPEVHGREAMTHAGYLLSVTERMVIANGIARIWSRQATSTGAAARLLADAYPDRHLLGLGVGGATPGVRPLSAMTEYLDELDALALPNPAPSSPVRRVLAAYGPKMLQLAAERALGSHTYHVTVSHTAEAREILGPEPLLAVEHAVLFEPDPFKAREIAREHLQVYLTTTYNIAKFKRLGFTDEDIADGGSDRIIDALVFWGDADSIVERLRGHVEAGADHVGVQVIGVTPGESAMPQWRQLADALL